MPSRNHLVSDLFQSHACGFFSAFTRATCSLSVSDQYLGLGFNAPYSYGIPKPHYSLTTRLIQFSLRGCHSLWPPFPGRSADLMSSYIAHISSISQWMIQFALLRFQSFYLRNRIFFLLLRVLRYFNSTRALAPLFKAHISSIPSSKADLRLPWAYRSLPRTSSLSEPSHPLGGLVTYIACFSSNQLQYMQYHKSFTPIAGRVRTDSRRYRQKLIIKQKTLSKRKASTSSCRT